MNNSLKKLIGKAIIISNDLLILSFALIESKFAAIFFGNNFTFESWFGWTIPSAHLLDPFSTDLNMSMPFYFDESMFIQMLVRFSLGVMCFLVVKLVLAMIFAKVGINLLPVIKHKGLQDL